MRLTVDRLGHLGDGVAEGPVFVAGGLPGEEVEGEPVAGRIEEPEILSPSPERVVPECPHYGACGGCVVMHAADPFVGRWKMDVVRHALAARGLAAPIRGIATSPARSRRRAVLSARRRRGGAVVGFHGRRSGTLTEIPECRVLVPEITAALPALARLAEAAATRKGELSLAVLHGPAGLDVAISGGREGRGLRDDLAAIAGEADLARLSLDGEPVAQARPPRQSIAGVSVVPPPGAFLQATRQGEQALIACVSRALGEARRVADLFAGCGTFALPVSRRADVHAVEAEAAPLAALDAAWRHGRGHRPLSTERRDLFRAPLAAAELDRFDAVVIDPPRAGAEAQMREIGASRLGTVAAVSCNPVTFARDAAILAEAGFALDWIRVIDQFRWSSHVELAARFTRG